MHFKRLAVLFATMLLIHVLATGQGGQWKEGFIDFMWNEEKGKVLIDITDILDEEFLYVSSLSAGVGSNDIGLDRNQLGQTRIVKFVKSGPRVLLMQMNYDYRADSDNPEERRAVEEAFAKSVIWGFDATRDSTDGKLTVDLTPFLLRDAHGLTNALKQTKQGSYKPDAGRSALNPERTKNFPDNSEFDAYVTFTGQPEGRYIRSVAPDASAITVQMHHSFIKLPDDGYEPRPFHVRSGYYAVTYADYATPIDQSLEKRFIIRHRLEKKDPAAARSEAVEPIVYYIDRGCPEPIKSALIEGASWWNEAFEAAGYIDAFQVKELPEDADPMDVRYNVINWVHRATRGWSYGSVVVDPRTGEIIKGHVLLGSLRVRQDFLIAQGLASMFEEGDESAQPLVELALARLRQLSAHEVGHTIGLSHNFAASVNDRASVMDYPHPLVELRDDGSMDFSNAYDTGIGEWDKFTVRYGYGDFPDNTDEDLALEAILSEAIDEGYYYISDLDARPVGGAHPLGHLWDNGTDAVQEMTRLQDVRKAALDKFGKSAIRNGTYMAYLEQVLVPLYYSHRFQVEAVAKLIGGQHYAYNVRGDAQAGPVAVSRDDQLEAAEILFSTLEPAFLEIDASIVELIPPHPEGIPRNRELLKGHTGPTFDPIAAAESSVDHTFNYALHPDRLSRLLNQRAYDTNQFGLAEYLELLNDFVGSLDTNTPLEMELSRMVEKRMVNHLIRAAAQSPNEQVVAVLNYSLGQLRTEAESRSTADVESAAHAQYIVQLVERFLDDPEEFTPAPARDMPPGSPIGCGEARF